MKSRKWLHTASKAGAPMYQHVKQFVGEREECGRRAWEHASSRNPDVPSGDCRDGGAECLRFFFAIMRLYSATTLRILVRHAGQRDTILGTELSL
jgi:hypothetical protein